MRQLTGSMKMTTPYPRGKPKSAPDAMAPAANQKSKYVRPMEPATEKKKKNEKVGPEKASGVNAFLILRSEPSDKREGQVRPVGQDRSLQEGCPTLQQPSSALLRNGQRERKLRMELRHRQGRQDSARVEREKLEGC